MTVPANAAAAGTIEIGGDMVVHRMGFGAMRITGPGIWGDPPDLERGQGHPATGGGTRRQLHRHRELLRP